MKRIPEFLGHYNAIDGYLESQLQLQANNPGQKTRLTRRQVVNDQAYFVLCWGQLEAELDELCRKAIRKRKNNADWMKRRAWDLYNPDDKRLSGLSFEERVSLVLDKQDNSGGEWKMVMTYYAQRNNIAHGGSHEQRIDLNSVIKEFYQIQSKIAP